VFSSFEDYKRGQTGQATPRRPRRERELAVLCMIPHEGIFVVAGGNEIRIIDPLRLDEFELSAGICVDEGDDCPAGARRQLHGHQAQLCVRGYCLSALGGPWPDHQPGLASADRELLYHRCNT